MHEFLVGDVRRSLWVLLACGGLVMLVGSVNLAGLLLARSSARAGEFALRTAVGASARPRCCGSCWSKGCCWPCWAAPPAC